MATQIVRDPTVFHERDDAVDNFTTDELRHCRVVLRRMRFLETKIREADDPRDPGGPGVHHAIVENAANTFLLSRAGYLRVSGVPE